MNNQKRNIHRSGPLGMLLNRGIVEKVESVALAHGVSNVSIDPNLASTTLKTQSYLDKNTGIEFRENELLTVQTNECEPWEYANRMEEEVGDINELIESIKENGQLQPVFIRDHPNPHDSVKYQIIFGRRRFIACNKLGTPLLAIKKDLSVQDAIATQDAENRSRKDVSNYSNAILYKRLIKDGIFNEEKEIADKLGIPKSTFNDLMAFTRIPEEIISRIPDIHSLSIQMALTIVSLIRSNKKNYDILINLAPQISKSISSAEKLKKAVENHYSVNSLHKSDVIEIKASNGKKLFICKRAINGKMSISFSSDVSKSLMDSELCSLIKNYLENIYVRSGHPD